MATVNCLVPNILQNLLCSTEETHTGLKRLNVEYMSFSFLSHVYVGGLMLMRPTSTCHDYFECVFCSLIFTNGERPGKEAL